MRRRTRDHIAAAWAVVRTEARLVELAIRNRQPVDLGPLKRAQEKAERYTENQDDA